MTPTIEPTASSHAPSVNGKEKNGRVGRTSLGRIGPGASTTQVIQTELTAHRIGDIGCPFPKATLPSSNSPKSTWTLRAEEDGAKESVSCRLHRVTLKMPRHTKGDVRVRCQCPQSGSRRKSWTEHANQKLRPAELCALHIQSDARKFWHDKRKTVWWNTSGVFGTVLHTQNIAKVCYCGQKPTADTLTSSPTYDPLEHDRHATNFHRLRLSVLCRLQE